MNGAFECLINFIVKVERSEGGKSTKIPKDKKINYHLIMFQMPKLHENFEELETDAGEKLSFPRKFRWSESFKLIEIESCKFNQTYMRDERHEPS